MNNNNNNDKYCELQTSWFLINNMNLPKVKSIDIKDE